MACRKGAVESAELLLQKGANIYAIDHRKWTSLHYAAYNGHPEMANMLLKFEADNDQLQGLKTSQNKLAFNMAKDEPTKKAFTHIWRACKEGDLDQVRVLLREG